MLRSLRNIIFLVLLLLCETVWAAKGTLVYVPMDNRPVCLDYTVQTMQAAGWEVVVPPAELIADVKRSGASDELFDWLEKEAFSSTAVVASADALLYGGLVGSRTHNIPYEVLKARAERLLSLKHRFHGQNVYVFSTIMRSPKASAAPVEPAYYSVWGPKLFRLGALEDKLDQNKIRHKEVKELAQLRRDIPKDVVDDLYQRRRNNLKLTELLLSGVESGDFDYMIVGRDDTAPHSQAHREARSLDILVSELPKEHISFFSGADQLGLLLLTRAAVRLQGQLPLVKVMYAPGEGGKTIPTYEDDTVAVSAKEHVRASGAFLVPGRRYLDLVLALNTPKNGVTLEAGDVANNGVVTPEVKVFTSRIKNTIAKGKPVAVADIKYGNGGDNALVKALFEKDLAYSISSYNGWNTAGNSLGYALAQGLLAPLYSPEAKRELLDSRYLDDWAYQANARMKVYQTLIWPKGWPGSGLDAKQQLAAEEAITKEITNTARPLMGDSVLEYNFSLPWNRMFEINVHRVDLK